MENAEVAAAVSISVPELAGCQVSVRTNVGDGRIARLAAAVKLADTKKVTVG